MPTRPSDFDWHGAFKREAAMSAAPSFATLLGETTMRIADAVLGIKTALLLDVLFERGSTDGVECRECGFPSGKTQFAVFVDVVEIAERFGFKVVRL